MACFTIPLAEALVVTAVKAVASHKKNADDIVKASRAESGKISFKEKLGYLQQMLFGGSALLAIEHIYHGEVVLYPPFLTAMRTPEEIPVMLREMATVGTGMAILTTAAWGIMVAVSALMKKRSLSPSVGKMAAAGGMA